MKLHAATIFICCAILSSSALAEPTTRTWVGGYTNSPWSVPTNWQDPGLNPGVPQDGDNVNIIGGVTYDFDYDWPLNAVNLTGFITHAGNNLLMTRNLSLASGFSSYMQSNGHVDVLDTLTVQGVQGWYFLSGGWLSSNVTQVHDNATIVISGTGTLTGNMFYIGPMGEGVLQGSIYGSSITTSYMLCEGMYEQSGGWLEVSNEFAIIASGSGQSSSIGSAGVDDGVASITMLTIRGDTIDDGYGAWGATLTHTGGTVSTVTTHVTTNTGGYFMSGGEFSAESLYIGEGPVGTTYGGAGRFDITSGVVSAPLIQVAAPPSGPASPPAILSMQGTNPSSLVVQQLTLGKMNDPTYRGDLALSSSNASVRVVDALRFYPGGGIQTVGAQVIEMGGSSALFNKHSATTSGGDDTLMNGWERVTLRYTEGFNPNLPAIYECRGFDSGPGLANANGRWIEDTTDGTNHFILDGLVMGAIQGTGQINTASMDFTYTADATQSANALYVNTLTIVSSKFYRHSSGGRGIIYYLNGGSPKHFIMGDVNLDGRVQDDDLSIYLSNGGTDKPWYLGDVSGDTVVNFNDLSLILANWTGDGLMSADDDSMSASSVISDSSCLAAWRGAGGGDADLLAGQLCILLADWQPSGDVQADMADLGRILDGWTGSGAATVPEPTLVSLLLVGSALSLIRRRRA